MASWLLIIPYSHSVKGRPKAAEGRKIRSSQPDEATLRHFGGQGKRVKGLYQEL